MMRPIQLRMARAALNWTLKDLAEKSSVDKNTISKYEAGGNVMSDALQRIENIMKEEGVRFIEEDDEYGPGVRMPNEFSLVAPKTAPESQLKGAKRLLKKRSQKAT